jgi:AraC family transcriptional activator of pobA
MIAQYDFYKTKYGDELLIDLIRLEHLEKYIAATPIHRLTYYDITIITEGTGTFSIDNSDHPIRQGTVVFSSPGQVRHWNISNIPKGYVVIFESEFLGRFFSDTGFVEGLSIFNHPGCLELSPIDYSHLVGVLESLEKEIGASDRHMLRALLYQILVFLNRKFNAGDKRPVNRYVAEFSNLVTTSHHLQRSVSYYADKLHITVGHLNSLVKVHFGVTAKQYILNRNILEAKRLLQYTTMDIDQVAAALNYESTSYFVRAFRLHTNVTPLHFRRLSNP